MAIDDLMFIVTKIKTRQKIQHKITKNQNSPLVQFQPYFDQGTSCDNQS